MGELIIWKFCSGRLRSISLGALFYNTYIAQLYFERVWAQIIYITVQPQTTVRQLIAPL